MDYLHLTSKKNLNSILTHGLLPQYVDLEHHWETFNKYGLKERRCVYLWDGETYQNSKFVRDMVYTKFFIHPRNKMYNNVEEEVEINFNKFGNQLYGDSSTFFLLKITDFYNEFGSWQHVQEPGGENFSTTTIMDDKYAHNDKRIHISDDTISPNKIEIVEKVNVRVYHDTHQLGFSFSKAT